MATEISSETIGARLFAAARDVFSSMLGTEVTAQPGQNLSSTAELLDGVVACIGLTGRWVGTGLLSCSTETACDLSARMLMCEAGPLNDDVLDAVGEIANMIIGNLKNHLEDLSGPIEMSTPTVVHGSRLSAKSMRNRTTISVICSYEDRHVTLVVNLSSD